MTAQLGETPPEEPYAFGEGYRTVELTVKYRLRIPQGWMLGRLDVDKKLTLPPMDYTTGAPDPDGGQGTLRFEPVVDVDFLTYQYWFREDPGPPSPADLSELEACRQALAVQVARAGNAEAEVERMRAARFAPGPTVFPSDLMPGRWMVRCDACRAGDLMCTTEAVATGFAERHVHVYPDDEGFIRGEGWPE